MNKANLMSVPSVCPACAGPLEIVRLGCVGCGTAVEGHFSLGWVGALSREQLAFVKVFLASRGKIKDVEHALGLSYPTVVARLDEVVAVVQGASNPPAAAPAPRSRTASRMSILEQLEAGTIDVDTAERLLRATKEKP